MRVLALAILVSAASGAAWGQAQPVVRAQVTPESVLVGEPAELTVTVLVPTWFTRPPVYPPFELANAITRLPADSSYPIRERVGSESWSGIVRTYEIYPLTGASYRMTGQSMNIMFANPGSDPISVDVEVPEVVLRGVVPEGAGSLDPYLAGRSLELGIDVEGQPDELEVGDAIVLTYRAELDGLPAIFLPPLVPALAFDGVSVYAAGPVVTDGEPARREEKVTLVFEAGGEFEIPGIDLDYWNTEDASVSTASAFGFTLSVAGPPVGQADAAGESSVYRWLAAVVLACGLLFAAWRAGPRLVRRRREAAERRRLSEPYAFAALDRALRDGNPRQVYAALLEWLSRIAAGLDARRFAQNYGDDKLRDGIDGLIAANYAASSADLDAGRLRAGLAAARRRCLKATATTARGALPVMNP